MKPKSVIQSVAIAANPHKINAKKESIRLRKWLKKHRIQVRPMSNLSRADALLTLGGDGTILSVASRAAAAGVPVLGINLGRLGFLTATDAKNMNSALEAWIRGKWIISERVMLEVSAPCFKKPHLALNDAVIRIGSTTRVTRINAVFENERLGCFVGDGVIVATPTGSTAYSLSASGPVVHPEMDAIVVTPICAHSFSQRPVVYPSHQVLEFQLVDPRANNEVQLVMDGQKVFLLKPSDKIKVRRSAYRLKLLQDPRVSYFRILREKLFWGSGR